MAVEITSQLALDAWRRTALALVREGEIDLSTRQLAILATIYMDLPPHTVRGLARRLNVTKPVITRALDSMGKHDLVARRRDPSDRRNVIVQRTVQGALYVERLGDIMAHALLTREE
jgi:DNA-binding MarR family transcriptional regulator